METRPEFLCLKSWVNNYTKYIDTVNKNSHDEYNKSGRIVIYGKHKHSYGCRFKAAVRAFCSDMVMSMTAAFNVFTRKAVSALYFVL